MASHLDSHSLIEKKEQSNKSLQLSAWVQSVEDECSPSNRLTAI